LKCIQNVFKISKFVFPNNKRNNYIFLSNFLFQITKRCYQILNFNINLNTFTICCWFPTFWLIPTVWSVVADFDLLTVTTLVVPVEGVLINRTYCTWKIDVNIHCVCMRACACVSVYIYMYLSSRHLNLMNLIRSSHDTLISRYSNDLSASKHSTRF